MKIVKRTMNWLPKPSAHEQMVLQRAKRREANRAFIEQQQALATSFATIRTGRTAGEVDITSKVALQRVLKQV